jgi:hypothetical protein
MKTNEALKARARAIVEMNFYSDDECEHIWEPFEDVDEEAIHYLMKDLEESILQAMLWAQET